LSAIRPARRCVAITGSDHEIPRASSGRDSLEKFLMYEGFRERKSSRIELFTVGRLGYPRCTIVANKPK
jgi:hypothetical protein